MGTLNTEPNHRPVPAGLAEVTRGRGGSGAEVSEFPGLAGPIRGGIICGRGIDGIIGRGICIGLGNGTGGCGSLCGPGGGGSILSGRNGRPKPPCEISPSPNKI